MYQNSNLKFVWQLSKRNYSSNKERNIVSILAIILTSFMLMTIFTVGLSYIKSYDLQQLQLLGTTGNATLDNPSDKQIAILENNNKVKNVGIREDVIQAGKVEYSGDNTRLYYALRYYDDIEWNKHRKPALDNIVGKYPRDENEIMMSSWVLKKMGVTNPQIGEKYEFSYNLGTEQKVKEFVLSGYFDEYDNSIKDGSVAYVLVSKKFVEDNKELLTQTIRIADISLVENIKNIEIENLEDSLNLQEKQVFSVNPELQSQMTVEVVIMVCFIILCIVACGYLLIYNIFNISITNNIHYYGQLKVIGITKNQIKGILLWQGIKLAIYGVLIGSLLGYLFSSFMVPIFLNSMLEKKTGIVACNMWVVIGTVVFTGITVFIAILKPAVIAGKISPIEAIRYEKNAANRTRKVKRRKRPTIFQMAIDNVLGDKKRCFLVLLSMTLGITACITIGALVTSMNTDNYVKSNMDSDIELKNKTTALGYDNEVSQVFDVEFINSLKNMEDIREISMIKQQLVVPMYEEEVFGRYVDTMLSGEEDIDPTYFKSYPNLFYSQMIGIEVTESLKNEYKDVDWNAFEDGQICLIPCSKPELINKGDTITFQLGSYENSTGKAIMTGNKYSITIGGYLPESYNNYGSARTAAPYVVVSQKYINSIAKDAIISNIMIKVNKQAEKAVNEAVNKLVVNSRFSDGIVVVSAFEKIEGLKQTKITLFGMGGSLAVVLALIGIINFINVINTSIIERSRDFVIMESIGLTKEQIMRLVTYESLIYFALTMLFVLTVGNGILLFVYNTFSSIVTYAEFSYPILLLLGIGFLLFLICYFVPKIAIGKNFSSTIVERLKTNE